MFNSFQGMQKTRFIAKCVLKVNHAVFRSHCSICTMYIISCHFQTHITAAHHADVKTALHLIMH